MLGFAVKAGGFRRQSEDGAVRRKHSWCYGGSPEVAKMTMVSMLPSPEGEDKHRPERSSKDAFSVAEVLHRVSGSPDDHAPHPGFHTGPHLGKAGGRAARCEDSCQSPLLMAVICMAATKGSGHRKCVVHQICLSVRTLS